MGIDARILLRIDADEVNPTKLKQWSYHICTAFGADKFRINRNNGVSAIELSGQRYHEEDDPPPGTFYYQDGSTIYAHKGEVLVTVHIWSRYYEIGYERGDLLFICAVAEWCEANIPSVEVWYGGDSSGAVATLFDGPARNKLKQHLYSPRGNDYYIRTEDNPDMFPTDIVNSCKLCIPDHKPSRFGWGQDFASYHCSGCGLTVQTQDHGQTWTEKRDNDT